MLLAFLAAASITPVQPPQTWFSAADYPAAALSKNAEGAVRVDLTISPSGAPLDCKVVGPAPEPSLNDQTCAVLLKKARFDTSHEEGGHGSQHYELIVKWALDDVKLDPIAFGSISEFAISPAGTIVNCKERLFGDEKAGLSNACEGINGGPKKILEFLMGTELGQVTKGALRLYVEPGEENSIEVSPPTAAKLVTLAEARFDVLPSGKVANCQTINISEKLPQKDLCGAFASTGTRFGAPAGAKTLPMRIIVDIWVS